MINRERAQGINSRSGERKSNKIGRGGLAFQKRADAATAAGCFSGSSLKFSPQYVISSFVKVILACELKNTSKSKQTGLSRCPSSRTRTGSS